MNYRNMTTQHNVTMKNDILSALHSFVSKRPGFDLRNYDSMAGYRGDQRPVQKQLATAKAFLRYVALMGGISGADILHSAEHTFSGRLTIEYDHKTGKCTVDYCTGQYWPTEYRLSVCCVLADVIFNYWRACNLALTYKERHTKAVREFGRAAAEYFK